MGENPVNNLDPDSATISQNQEGCVYVQGLNANVSSTVFGNIPTTFDYVIYCDMVCTATGIGDTVPTITINYTDDSGANSFVMPNAPATPTIGANGKNVISIFVPAGSTIAYTISGGVYSNGSLYSLRLIYKIL